MEVSEYIPTQTLRSESIITISFIQSIFKVLFYNEHKEFFLLNPALKGKSINCFETNNILFIFCFIAQ